MNLLTDPKIGVLLVNLGTPSAPTKRAVRQYLAEFLADPHVVELPAWLWLPFLHGVVLPLRAPKSAALYQKIWTEAGSPLLLFSKKIAEGINATLQQVVKQPIQVELAMRYGSPSIAEKLELFRKNEIKKLIILPLYPQYSGAATGTIFAKVTAILKEWRNVPEVHFINQYGEDSHYIAALSNHIKQHWHAYEQTETLLFSFHGLPHNSIAKGDPYHQQCLQTAELVATDLKLAKDRWQVVFQSRFGKQPWLQPYCDKTLEHLAQQGHQHITVVCPGFAADCLETLEEIAIRNKDIFFAAGGQQLNYIPALNDSPAHLQALTNLIIKNL